MQFLRGRKLSSRNHGRYQPLFFPLSVTELQKVLCQCIMDGVSIHFEGLAGYEAIFKTFIAMLVIALIATIVFP